MTNVFSRSYHLTMQSVRVLRHDPELMLFPVISFIALVVGVGLLGGLLLGTGYLPVANETTFAGIVGLFLTYLVSYFIVIYFQVALVSCVQHRLDGGNPHLGYGIRSANRRLGAIFSWAVVAAIVGLLLRLLESMARRRTAGVGQIIARIAIGLVGMAWSLATFFVIPVIAAEGVGGFEAVKRSAGIIKRRWGEAVIGRAGIGLFLFLATAAVVLVLVVLGFLAASAGGTAGAGVAIALFVMAGIAVLVMLAAGSTLQAIYTAVVHRFAMTGEAPEGFPAAMLADTFGQRRGGLERGII